MNARDRSRQQEFVTQFKQLLEREKYNSIQPLLAAMHAADIAWLLEDLDLYQQRALLRLLKPRVAAEVFENLEATGQVALVRRLSDARTARILEHMSQDELADLIGQLPAAEAAELLERIDRDDAEQVRGLLTYPADSAGGIMTTALVTMHRDTTASDAIEQVRAISPDAEAIYYLYVTGDNQELVGVVSLRRLIAAPASTPVSQLMETQVISVPAELDQEQVAEVVARYDLLAVPVVDDASRLLGIVTVDDVIDVLEQEATEDMVMMGGTWVQRESRLETSLVEQLRGRLPWLVFLFMGELLAAAVITHYQPTLQSMVGLAFFIPLLLGMGGNVATQSLAVTVRGLATGQLLSRQIWAHLWRELRVGLLIAVSSGLVALVVGYLWQGNLMLGLVVATAMVVNLVLAVVLGTAVPYWLARIHADPAAASGPLAATCMDVIGMLVYFLIAALLLRPF